MEPEGLASLQEELRGPQLVLEKTGLSIADLVKKFDSLGDDCEFGLFQRKCGAEPLGLFRFSNPKLPVIMRAIQTGFVGFGENATVELDQQKRREWILVDKENKLRQHTHIYEGEQTRETVTHQQLTRSRFLRDKIVQDMSLGSKIFVVKSLEHPLATVAAHELAELLRRNGPNWLVWVEPGLGVGDCKVLAPGLIYATIDRLTQQPNGREFSYAGWTAVVTGAWLEIRKHLSDDSPLL